MSAPSIGLKKTCDACEARFYDLNKDPAECPVCQAIQKPPKRVQRRARRAGEAADDTMQLAPARAGVKWR